MPETVIVKRKVEPKFCGGRRLPANPAFDKTVILKTAPQSWNFRQCGAKWWA